MESLLIWIGVLIGWLSILLLESTFRTQLQSNNQFPQHPSKLIETERVKKLIDSEVKRAKEIQLREIEAFLPKEHRFGITMYRISKLEHYTFSVPNN